MKRVSNNMNANMYFLFVVSFDKLEQGLLPATQYKGESDWHPMKYYKQQQQQQIYFVQIKMKGDQILLCLVLILEEGKGKTLLPLCR